MIPKRGLRRKSVYGQRYSTGRDYYGGYGRSSGYGNGYGSGYGYRDSARRSGIGRQDSLYGDGEYYSPSFISKINGLVQRKKHKKQERQANSVRCNNLEFDCATTDGDYELVQ